MTGREETARRETSPGKVKPRILVVDDECTIAVTLALILERQGYWTTTAYSGEEAVQVAPSFLPDLILSDVIMGAMNGIEAVTEILAILPRCKVLFISGNAAYVNLLEDARAKGFTFDFLSKPVPPLELLTRISHLLSEPAN